MRTYQPKGEEKENNEKQELTKKRRECRNGLACALRHLFRQFLLFV